MPNETSHVDSILEALDLEALPEEEQEEILLDLNDLVLKGTIVRLLEQMDEKTSDAFNALLAKDASEEEMEAFLAENVPNSDDAIRDTIQELTDDILAVTA